MLAEANWSTNGIQS